MSSIEGFCHDEKETVVVEAAVDSDDDGKEAPVDGPTDSEDVCGNEVV